MLLVPIRPLRELVEDGVVLGEQLARHVERDASGPCCVDRLGEDARRRGRAPCPTTRARARCARCDEARDSSARPVSPSVAIKRNALAAELAAIRGMLGIAANADDAAARGLDAHAAAHAAVAVVTGGAGPCSSRSKMHDGLRRTSTANVSAHPSSGATAWPQPSSTVHPCSGHTTRSPVTRPCDSGPPRCGQRSSSANTSSLAVRNTAIGVAPSRCDDTRAAATGYRPDRQSVHPALHHATVSGRVLAGGRTDRRSLG